MTLLHTVALGGLVSGLPSVGNGSTSMGHTQTQANLTSNLHMMASSILSSDQNSSNGVIKDKVIICTLLFFFLQRTL